MTKCFQFFIIISIKTHSSEIILHYLTHFWNMKSQIIFLAFPLELLIIITLWTLVHVYVDDIDHGITVTKPMLLEMKNIYLYFGFSYSKENTYEILIFNKVILVYQNINATKRQRDWRRCQIFLEKLVKYLLLYQLLL